MHAKVQRNASRKHKVTFAQIIADIGTPKDPRRNGIPVHISSRHAQNLDLQYSDEFCVSKKRPKRFFISGYKDSITESQIAAYVNWRGPRVTFVTIFPSRKSSGFVIVRLNLEADENCHLVEHPGFWPDNVYCKPWLSSGVLQRRRSNHMRPTYKSHDWTSSTTADTEYRSYYNYNMYSQLSSID